MRIALLGYGRMGRAVEREAEAAGHVIAARLGHSAMDVAPTDLAQALVNADVAIDFTTAGQVPRSAEAAAIAGISLVIGTTGWDAVTGDLLRTAAERVAIVHGANFSIGVHLFFRLAREAAALAGRVGGYDPYVHETHHRHKVDHPSGTARRLADLVVEARGAKDAWTEGPPQGAADPSMLYVTSTRAGDVPGTHVLGLDGPHDDIRLVHTARDRVGFALGAVRAAEWVHEEKPGLHTFEEVVDDLLRTRP